MKSLSSLSLALVATVGIWAGCGDGGAATDDQGPDADASPSGTTFTVALNGGEQVPAMVETSASGTATLTLSADKTQLVYNITHTVAAGTAAHIHLGEAGENGMVVFPLTPFGPAMTGTISVTAADVENLEAGKLYVNVHSDANAMGELRGQILPPGAALYVARLTGAQEAPEITTLSVGTAAVILNAAKTKIRFHVATTATVTGAHIHRAIATQNGPVAYPLAPLGTTIDGEQDVSAVDVTDLGEGHFYVNLHTENNQAGEVRGQLIQPGEILYSAALSGLNQVPTPVDTETVGGGQFILSPDRKALRYEVAVMGGPAINAAHLHTGAVGTNGTVRYPLTLASPGVKGTQAVVAADVTALDAAGIYVNLHSATSPDGETRAQLLRK